MRVARSSIIHVRLAAVQTALIAAVICAELVCGMGVVRPCRKTKVPAMQKHVISSSRHTSRARAPIKMPKAPDRDHEQLTTLRLMCETSGGSFDYDVPSDAGTLKDLWDRRLMVSCPHCHQVHGFLFRTAYVNAVLSGTRLAFDSVGLSAGASRR